MTLANGASGADQGRAAGPTVLGPTVLVVDDDPVVVRSMTVLLNRAGFAVAGCTTGAAALERATGPGGDSPVAAAVLDIHLPDANGLSLSQQLRASLGPAVPIIILSGDNSMQTIRALPDAGATYFFAKPVNTGMLIRQLKQWTGQGDGQPPVDT